MPEDAKIVCSFFKSEQTAKAHCHLKSW